MFDHISVGVSNIARSAAFYDRALQPLGIKQLMHVTAEQTGGGASIGYGKDRPCFWIGERADQIGTAHVAFEADDREVVRVFFDEAIAAGGRDNGGPGPRPYYHPDYYGAFVLDPDGHNIEAVCRRPA